jgi:hypothetical protein
LNPIAKLLRADETRKTRFHTANGYLCLNPVEFFNALTTTFARRFLQKYSSAPWLVYSAAAYIEPLVRGKRILEFGSGMSTIWFSSRCSEVVSVEHNPEWYKTVVDLTRDSGNVKVIFAESKEDYWAAISRAGGKFDIILIDGWEREGCVQAARPYLNANGLVIVDNTDVDDDLSRAVEQTFPDSKIRAFHGWAPGILHPNETLVIEGVPATS